MLSLNAILNDFDELLQKQQPQDNSMEECKTIDRWARYTQSSKRSLMTRRFSQIEDNKQQTENIKVQSQLFTQEDLNEVKARIRFEQKTKEIEKNAKLKSSHKALEIVNIHQIKAEVRQQLGSKKKKGSPVRVVKSSLQKENKGGKSKCQQCIQLLSMGLPTKHCINH
ncbi:unnamed protein product (macronuclear) [Paramecium tetraurelia]|uniref:Uncharacterized protein n=1 Tax=Paramecium tetraurelia TaxID=5888 RepID=A0BZV6_PARTE|nr:uncharacterized protein GSPATT00005925001 [Paramecium tetraurelia]CAK64073.1 unnamed protein product [Paramecium tetraurelia]|eukprot:XP_001431471.1 hypothetical protein (macronuclear) [Paramecium tetraurelia strain d4-2]